MRPAWVEINLDTIKRNMEIIRKQVPSHVEVMAVVKANAYGHGAVEVAKTVLQSGATRLAVSEMDEALELRQHGIEAPILILGTVELNQAELALQNNITLAVYNYDFAVGLSQIAKKLHKTALVHIKIDTGMGRIGYPATQESVQEIARIAQLPDLTIEGIFTHFALADTTVQDYTKLQYQRFCFVYQELAKLGINIPVHHCANSAAIAQLDCYEDMVRAGIILYGMEPSAATDMRRLRGVRPAISLKCRIMHIKTLSAGDSVGYGRKFIATKPTVVATLPIGYADGYTRLFSGKAYVLIHGQKAPILGNICMDQCMVDITHIKGAKIGDEVVLIGEQGGKTISPELLATLIGTINYEIVCMLGRRLPRCYYRNGKLSKIDNYILM